MSKQLGMTNTFSPTEKATVMYFYALSTFTTFPSPNFPWVTAVPTSTKEQSNASFCSGCCFAEAAGAGEETEVVVCAAVAGATSSLSSRSSSGSEAVAAISSAMRSIVACWL